MPDPSSLTSGHRPRNLFSSERVPILIAPEARDRLNQLLNSPGFAGTGVGYSAFIDRACEAAEAELAQEAARATVTELPLHGIVLVDGVTELSRERIRVIRNGPSPSDVIILVDGEEQAVKRFDQHRDGGTCIWWLKNGKSVKLPRRIRPVDRRPRYGAQAIITEEASR